MILVNSSIPTSSLLELKVGDYITDEQLSGEILKIDIQETDEYLLFLFTLKAGEIVVRKLKQIC